MTALPRLFLSPDGAHRNQRENLMRKSLKLLIVTSVMSAALPLGLGLAVAGTAYAGTGTACSGNSCNGLDPTQSFNSGTGAECSSGAFNVADLPNGESALGGLLELRWGPNCGTNWTRFTPGNNDTYEIWVTRLSDGVWAGTGLFNPYIFSGARGVSHYSDQVYIPGNAAACVRDITTNSNDFCFQQ